MNTYNNERSLTVKQYEFFRGRAKNLEDFEAKDLAQFSFMYHTKKVTFQLVRNVNIDGIPHLTEGRTDEYGEYIEEMLIFRAI